nr:hypothetical protein [Candidatus Sigynarchaeota archaeon]
MLIWILYRTLTQNNKLIAEKLKAALESAKNSSQFEKLVVKVKDMRVKDPKSILRENPGIVIAGGPIHSKEMKELMREWDPSVQKWVNKFDKQASKWKGYLAIYYTHAWKEFCNDTEVWMEKYYSNLKLHDRIIEPVLHAHVVEPPGPLEPDIDVKIANFAGTITARAIEMEPKKIEQPKESSEPKVPSNKEKTDATIK